MPYQSVSDALKKHPNLAKYSEHGRRVWKEVFNNAFTEYDDEGRAFSAAYSAANKADEITPQQEKEASVRTDEIKQWLQKNAATEQTILREVERLITASKMTPYEASQFRGNVYRQLKQTPASGLNALQSSLAQQRVSLLGKAPAAAPAQLTKQQVAAKAAKAKVVQSLQANRAAAAQRAGTAVPPAVPPPAAIAQRAGTAATTAATTSAAKGGVKTWLLRAAGQGPKVLGPLGTVAIADLSPEVYAKWMDWTTKPENAGLRAAATPDEKAAFKKQAPKNVDPAKYGQGQPAKDVPKTTPSDSEWYRNPMLYTSPIGALVGMALMQTLVKKPKARHYLAGAAGGAAVGAGAGYAMNTKEKA